MTVFPCGPPSEGWRKEREGWSVKEAGQRQTPRRVERKLRRELRRRRFFCEANKCHEQ